MGRMRVGAGRRQRQILGATVQVEKGKALHMRVYQFLKEPLIRRFGKEWYDELCEVARQFNL